MSLPNYRVRVWSTPATSWGGAEIRAAYLAQTIKQAQAIAQQQIFAWSRLGYFPHRAFVQIEKPKGYSPCDFELVQRYTSDLLCQ